jgi:hypothetical protein
MMVRWILSCVPAVVLVMSLAGCNTFSDGKEPPARTVTLADLPEPAKATVEKLMVGGKIKTIEQEEENGSPVFDVEGTVNGKDVEYDVAADGKVLSSEQRVPYESLPASVRMAATVYFGSAETFPASKEIEGDKTFYEVEGKKDGTRVTLKLSDTGKIVEEEKE